jgi:hypothetical protein
VNIILVSGICVRTFGVLAFGRSGFEMLLSRTKFSVDLLSTSTQIPPLYEGWYEDKASNLFLRKHNCSNNELYVVYSYISCNYEAIFPQSLHHFEPDFASVEYDAVYRCCKIPCLDFGVHHEWCKESKKLPKRFLKFRPNRNMEDVHFHNSARPHTSLRARETIAKIEWTDLFHRAQSPDLAPSDYHLFGPVKYALR